MAGVVFLTVTFSACSTAPERAPVIGQAYTGPIQLPIRQDLTPRSSAVATLKHGEMIEILQTRRRFVRVRTAAGIEGWTDSRHLLSAAQMAELDAAATRYTGAPSQGRATVYDPLNVHTTPNRGSPSFYMIPAGGTVEVVGHRLEARTPFQPPPLVPPPKTPEPKSRRRAQKEPEIAPPPKPAPPRVPDNWLELSRRARPTPDDEEPGEGIDTPAAPAPADLGKPQEAPVAPRPDRPKVSYDDWSLVRTPGGKVGWVLTRQLTMAIPDEVAQYAEGHRITSYFSLGTVRDGDETKHHWLWTTIDGGLQPYQFDGFRIFTWSLRKHRYETSYIERKVRGYFPGAAHPVEVTQRGTTIKVPGFSLVTEDRDGKRYQRTYAYEGYRVRMVKKIPWQPPPEPAMTVPARKPEDPGDPWYSRLKTRVAGWFRRR